jgi:uncharacterized membrane protein (UPF0136 family)
MIMALNSPVIVLWVYIVLLLAGGLMGFLKAGSKISLIMSVAFAVPLILCALGILRPFFIAEILVGLLAVVFGVRFAKGKKFMPSGLMLALSVIVLAALLLLH